MKSVYIINVQMTGGNGNVIHFVDEAYLNVETANKNYEQMTETYKDDPNFMAYIMGPILLNEN